MRAYVRACMRACVCVCVHACARVFIVLLLFVVVVLLFVGCCFKGGGGKSNTVPLPPPLPSPPPPPPKPTPPLHFPYTMQNTKNVHSRRLRAFLSGAHFSAAPCVCSRQSRAFPSRQCVARVGAMCQLPDALVCPFSHLVVITTRSTEGLAPRLKSRRSLWSLS